MGSVMNDALSEGMLNLVRGMVRPICTIMSLLSCILIQAQTGEVPPAWLLGITGALLGIYGVERSVLKFKGKVK
jgi:hypothetical protein